jgi:hypothetical protein
MMNRLTNHRLQCEKVDLEEEYGMESCRCEGQGSCMGLSFELEGLIGW